MLTRSTFAAQLVPQLDAVIQPEVSTSLAGAKSAGVLPASSAELVAWSALVALAAWSAFVAVIAVDAVVALAAVFAVVALSADVAWLASGTIPSVAALIWLPVNEPLLTFDAVTAPPASFAPVTAPFLSCLVPTELWGRLVAAYAVPDMATKIATNPRALWRPNAVILANI